MLSAASKQVCCSLHKSLVLPMLHKQGHQAALVLPSLVCCTARGALLFTVFTVRSCEMCDERNKLVLLMKSTGLFAMVHCGLHFQYSRGFLNWCISDVKLQYGYCKWTICISMYWYVHCLVQLSAPFREPGIPKTMRSYQPCNRCARQHLIAFCCCICPFMWIWVQVELQVLMVAFAVLNMSEKHCFSNDFQLHIENESHHTKHITHTHFLLNPHFQYGPSLTPVKSQIS